MPLIKFLGSTNGRWVRGIAGVVLVVLGVILGGWWLLLVLLGIVFISAGVFDFCLLAPLFGKPFNGSALRASF